MPAFVPADLTFPAFLCCYSYFMWLWTQTSCLGRPESTMQGVTGLWGMGVMRVIQAGNLVQEGAEKWDGHVLVWSP